LNDPSGLIIAALAPDNTLYENNTGAPPGWDFIRTLWMP